MTVKVSKLEIIDGLYMCTSFRQTNPDSDILRATVSFLVESEDKNTIVELCITDGGPITRIEKCDEFYVNAQKHWMFGWCEGFGEWTQLGVSENDLPNAIINNDWEHVKNVLIRFL